MSNEWMKAKYAELLQTHPLKEGGRDGKHLEFAHLLPTGLNGRGRGKAKRVFDILKNPDSYILLSKKTHRYLDRIYGNMGDTEQ